MALLTAGHPLSDSPSGPDQPTDWRSVNTSLPPLPTYVWTRCHPRYFIISFSSTSHFPYLTGCYEDKSALLQLGSYFCSFGHHLIISMSSNKTGNMKLLKGKKHSGVKQMNYFVESTT